MSVYLKLTLKLFSLITLTLTAFYIILNNFLILLNKIIEIKVIYLTRLFIVIIIIFIKIV
jgi:hypothetical protein